MSLIIKFIRLPYLDKRVAIESLFWLSMVRIMIWGFSFFSVQKKVQKIASRYNYNGKNVPMSRICLMIVIAARYVPKATCLVQALAGHILFSKYGYKTSIKIGVFNEEGEFEAHAWLEHNNIVVLGKSEKNFKTILDMGS